MADTGQDQRAVLDDSAAEDPKPARRSGGSNVLDSALERLKDLDPKLASTLTREVDALRRSRKFGLVFEKHLPESVRLLNHPIKRGVKVALKDPEKKEERLEWRVARVTGKGTKRVAHLVGPDGPAAKPVPVSKLVVIREFGEPVYPGLQPRTRIEAGDPDAPWHTVINGENFHALQALRMTHRGKVDLIYIDPPYNTGNKSWIYNDRYVADTDADRHSKWLSFMERRLTIAHELLAQTGLILIHIDDKEHAHLKLLCDQVFGHKHFVANLVWRTDGNIDNQAKVKENHEYVLMYARSIDDLVLSGVKDPNLSDTSKLYTSEIRNSVVKNGPKNPVSDIELPAGFPAGFKQGIVKARDDKWPHYSEDLVVEDGRLQTPVTASSGWASANLLRRFIELGFAQVSDTKGQATRFELTQTGAIENVKARRDDQHHILTVLTNLGTTETAGNELAAMGTRFPYPKPVPLSSYLISFAPRSAVILDFFGGSGTATESAIRLNIKDGGTRQCILITNNELSSSDADRLRKDGYLPGDPEWEARGVCRYVTEPRLSTVVTGIRPDGSNYSDGLPANIEFFDLAYLDEDRVSLDREFEAIAPLLWMQAGGVGQRISAVSPDGYAAADRYAVLFDVDATESFLNALADMDTPSPLAFVVTDSIAAFEAVATRLPAGTSPYKLYESYLRNFEINTETA